MEKSLAFFCIKECASRIKHAAAKDKQYQAEVCIAQKHRSYKYNRPAHDEIDGKRHLGDFAPCDGFIQDTKDNHCPLQRCNNDALPAADNNQRNGCVCASNGDIDEDMI